MRRITLTLLFVLALALVGCDAAAPDPTPVPPTPTPTPEAWLARAVQAWNETGSFHFELALVNRSIPLDAGGTLAFDEVQGDVVAPDRLRAETLVKTLVGNASVAFVAIGDEQWLTNPLTGRWEVAPPNMQAEVTGIFDPQAGLGSLLAEMERLQRLPDETLEGVETVRLQGTLPGALLADFAPDLADGRTVTVDLWMDRETGRLQQVVLTEPPADGETAIWTFRFSAYDAMPTIEPPV